MSRYENPVETTEQLSPEAIQSEVERVLGSQKFARSKRLRSLLRFTVSQTLQGHADSLKEYVIGTEVLKKPETYDPRSDSLVRVLASRLRVKLREYYSDGGSEDPLVIEFPKGKYVPRFQRREQLQTETKKKLHARNAYSRAKFLCARYSPAALAEAATLLEEAIEANPDWEIARSAAANVYMLQAFLGLRRPREVWPLVRAQAELSLELDEMSAEAHIALGMLCALFEWRWQDAELHFRKAIERDSYSGAGHLWGALGCLIPTGNLSGAQAELQTAHTLARSAFLDEGTALALYLSGKFDDVLRVKEHAAGNQLPTWIPWLQSCALIGLNRVREATERLERLHGENPHSVQIAATLGFAYGTHGLPESAREISGKLRAIRSNGAWVGNYEMALVEAGLGNQNEALALLQEALREKEPFFAYAGADPRMNSLRASPKFISLVRRTVCMDGEALGQGATT